MDFLGILGSLGGLFGGQGQRQAASGMERLADYTIGKRRDVYDPIAEKQVIPALQRRMKQGPFYSRNWLQQARSLRKPLTMMA